MADDNLKGHLRLNHFHGLRLESEDFQRHPFGNQ